MTLTPSPLGLLDHRAILRELDREARAREVEFAAEVLYQLGRACPFPGLVHYEPDRELLLVTVAGVTLATMTAEEVRRAPLSGRAGALLLGLRARDAYLDLHALEHDHTLGQD